MKKFLIVLIVAGFLAPLLASPALAAGEPPKDILKGVFTQVDPQLHTATFAKNTGEVMTLSIPETMKSEEIRLNKKVMVSLDKHAGEGVIKGVDVMF
ncbi:MAG TPA: hypothetical protein VLA15_02580, partial [Desulfurivibrionaceae bacterium]|nr:hypothetical protein [Desulfurivibrionaceae bacterium]